MQHQPSEVLINETKDYRKFSVITGNRGINAQKIKRIIADIEGGNDILKYCPILVKDNGATLDILDGQHRFIISQRLSRNVHYILIAEDKNMKDIATVNSNVEKWKRQDFLNCYITQGNENYVQLQDFINAYGMNIGTCIILLSSGQPFHNNSSLNTYIKQFEKGIFEIKCLKQSTELADLCKKFDASPIWLDRAFVQAIFKIRKAALIKMEDLIEAFNKRPDMLGKQVSDKAMIINLEQIMNVGKKHRIVIA